MSYMEREYMEYLYNVGGIASPGTYINYLKNIEKKLNVDIDQEYDKDKCKSLYDHLQYLRKNPEGTGKNEVYFRNCASRINKYIGFRNWRKDAGDLAIESIKNSRDSLGDADVQTTRYWLYNPSEEMWDIQCKDGIIILDCKQLGDLRNFNSREEIDLEYKSINGENTSNIKRTHMIWQFAKEMSKGDIVIAKGYPT